MVFVPTIHQLDKNYLIDPYWKEIVINPSRCAILCSDQWGTVSHSYKQDLLNNSPLKEILNKK
ncbi:MAG: glycogen/starch synthase, partial [Prevotella sp.]|nr:glycogen/starch synthase [Prevotella sp.]